MTEQTPSLEHPQVRKNAEGYEIVVDDAGTVVGFTVAIDYDTADGRPSGSSRTPKSTTSTRAGAWPRPSCARH